MSKWRVIEHVADAFEVQRKGIWFWGSCHSTAMTGPVMPMFRSLQEAKDFIDRQSTPSRIVYEQ